ncbi:MAG: DinB family protein [Ginsengibacter sp.]
MKLTSIFLKELQKESKVTRKMLERVPSEKFDWKAHPKSMSVKEVASHIAELAGWIPMVLSTEELDFASMDYKLPEINSTDDLMNLLNSNIDMAESFLKPDNEEKLSQIWVLRSGETIHSKETKAEVIRMVFNQITHHRAQLGVYLRLLDIPIPATYGPSADDTEFGSI